MSKKTLEKKWWNWTLTTLKLLLLLFFLTPHVFRTQGMVALYPVTSDVGIAIPHWDLKTKQTISLIIEVGKIQHCRAYFWYDFYFMTFNIILFFLLMMCYSLKVQAGLGPRVLSVLCVLCVWMVEDVFVRYIDAAFVSHKGQKVSSVTMYHLRYEV